MKKYNYIQKAYYSVLQPIKILEFISDNTTKAILFIALFSFIISMPYAFTLASQFNSGIDEAKNVISSEDFPDFNLVNGKLNILSDKPYIYTIEDKVVKIIIDSSSTFTFNDLAGYAIGYLITPNNIVNSRLGQTPVTLNYSEITDSPIDKASLIKFLDSFKPVFSGIIIVGYLLMAIMTTFIKSMLSYLIVSFTKATSKILLLPAQSYKLALYSMAGPLLFVEIIRFLNISSAYHLAIFVFVNGLIINRIFIYIKKIMAPSH